MRLFDQQSQRDKYKNNLQIQYIYKIKNSDSPEHTTLKRLHQFFATMNVSPDTKKTSSSHNSAFNFYNMLS